jgi:sialidase-1
MNHKTANFYALPLLLLLFAGLQPAKKNSAPSKGARSTTIMLPGNVPLEMVKIPPGTFLMGQRPCEQDAYPNKETPQHAVTLTSGFQIGRYEITKEQWYAVMATKPWKGRTYTADNPLSPAVYISWNDATAFVAKLSEITGKQFQLPTEAQWEYVCRAGTQTRFYWGDDPEYKEIGKYAWWRGNALVTQEASAHKVGMLPPNPWGLYDLSGNVSEWCHDWHNYYKEGPATDPLGPDSAQHRVLRGGSWISIGGHCRSSRRHHELPTMAHSDFGFRVLLAEQDKTSMDLPGTTDLFVCGTGGVNTYRIPSLLLAPDSSLLAFCEARKESVSDASPTDMILRRSTDGGHTWLPTQTLVQGKGKEALMNPCPVIDRTNNRILLFCIDAHKYGDNLHRQLLLTSDDNGKNWSEPIEIARQISKYDSSFVSGPGVGIQLKSGRLIIPGYTGDINDELDENFYSCVVYSDDHGKSWIMGKRVGELSDESQALELNDGTLMLNMRGNMGMSCRGVATSKNGGDSWSSVRWDRMLNECPCQASIVRYSFARNDQKNRILFANPDNSGERFGILDRTRMTVRLSYDEGQTWPVKKLIHPGPSSYSTMVRLPDGDIGLLFEGGEKHRREWIRFVRFSLEWLTDGDDHLK